MSSRVAITGVGVISNIGQGKQSFWQALKEGRSGYGPITLFEIDERFNVGIAGEVSDFDPKKYMGPKGLRSLDRSTKMLCSSARLAIDDCGFEITEQNTDDVGVSVGATFGSLKSISDFDKIILTEGPRYTNPAHFPNTVINSPASQVSIWNNIQGFNSTISTGFTASLDAMSYAFDYIQMDRSKLILTGSVEELCESSFLGFHTLKCLSGSKKGEPFINCPFDKRRNGMTFGEGACLLAFEEMTHALKRKAKIMAEVLGFGYYFDPFRPGKFRPSGIGMVEAMREAIQDAGLEPKDIGYICANANSMPDADRIETKAIKEVFGEYSEQLPISAIKSMIGESYGAGGAFAAAASVGVIQQGFLPPTLNYRDKDPECDLNYVPNQSQSARIDKILINTFGLSGNYSSMVIGRYDG